MKSLSVGLKSVLFIIYTTALNGFFYVRFYYNALRGAYSKDYINSIRSDYKLSFSDDFNSNEIDWSKWNKWWSNGSGSDRTKSAAVHSLDCLKMVDGMLHISTEMNTNPETVAYPFKCGNLYSQPSTYYENDIQKTSGFQQNYGYYEIRCKPPKQGKLAWAAFWLWGIVWPPEIDIFEFMSTKDIGTNNTKGMSMTNHWGYPNKENGSNYFGSQLGRTYRKLFGISVNWDENFHVFGCNWTPYYIDYYVDDIRVYRSISNIPSNPMSININTAVCNEIFPKSFDLPLVFVVDYVRAYKK